MDKSFFILSINGGSSSIKFAFYKISEQFSEIFKGEIEKIGAKNVKFNFTSAQNIQKDSYCPFPDAIMIWEFAAMVFMAFPIPI